MCGYSKTTINEVVAAGYRVRNTLLQLYLRTETHNPAAAVAIVVSALTSIFMVCYGCRHLSQGDLQRLGDVLLAARGRHLGTDLRNRTLGWHHVRCPWLIV